MLGWSLYLHVRFRLQSQGPVEEADSTHALGLLHCRDIDRNISQLVHFDRIVDHERLKLNRGAYPQSLCRLVLLGSTQQTWKEFNPEIHKCIAGEMAGMYQI